MLFCLFVSFQNDSCGMHEPMHFWILNAVELSSFSSSLIGHNLMVGFYLIKNNNSLYNSNKDYNATFKLNEKYILINDIKYEFKQRCFAIRNKIFKIQVRKS